MSSSPLFSLCTFWAFVLLSRHALLSAPLLLGEFFCVFFFPFLSSPSNAFPGPLTHFLLSGDFSRRRCGSLRAVQRRFAFPLPVYSISKHTQLPPERLHAPVFAPVFFSFVTESLWFAVLLFFLVLAACWITYTYLRTFIATTVKRSKLSLTCSFYVGNWSTLRLS